MMETIRNIGKLIIGDVAHGLLFLLLAIGAGAVIYWELLKFVYFIVTQ